jgi:hypothetical protein
MSTPNPGADRCPHCGDTDLARGVELGLAAESGNVGLKCQVAFVFGGTEPSYVDLCQTCGSVARLYVKETNRKWRNV